jgi:type I restriction enzyme, S subunit
VSPPRSEQALIISFLDGETDRLDRMIAKVEEAIARLQEYRTALITAAVTGKIDLREGIPASEPAMLVAAG